MANASPLLYACLLFSLVLFAAGADIQEKINPANPPIVNANTTANSSSLEAASGANTQEKNKTDVIVVNSQTNSTNGTQLVASPRLDETNKPNSGNQSANSTTKNDDEKQVKSGADQKLGKRQVEEIDEDNEKEEPKLDENESDTAKLVYETEDVKNGSVIVTNGTNVARDANATEAVTQLSPPLSSGSNETLSKTSNQTNQVLTNQTQPVVNQTAVVVGSNNTSNQTNNQTKVEEQKPAGEEKEKEKEAEKEKEKEAEKEKEKETGVNSDPKKPDEKTSDKPTSSATGNEEFPQPEIEGKEEEKGNEKGEKEEEKGEERGNEKEEEKNENENNPDENDKLNETYPDNEAQENKNNNNNNNQKEAQQQQQQPKLPDSGSYQNNNRNPGKMPSDSFDDDESSSTSFLTYFLILSTLCVVLYVSYHNRSKIMGLIVEGPSGSKRRVIDSRVYNRLENVRDAMPNA